MVQRSDLAVGAEVGCRNLKSDLIVSQFVHLLCQKVGFSHQGVGFHDLLPESRKALTKKLIPDTHKQQNIEIIQSELRRNLLIDHTLT